MPLTIEAASAEALGLVRRFRREGLTIDAAVAALLAAAMSASATAFGEAATARHLQLMADLCAAGARPEIEFEQAQVPH